MSASRAAKALALLLSAAAAAMTAALMTIEPATASGSMSGVARLDACLCFFTII